MDFSVEWINNDNDCFGDFSDKRRQSGDGKSGGEFEDGVRRLWVLAIG